MPNGTTTGGLGWLREVTRYQWMVFLVAWLGDVSAVLLITIRTYRLIFQPSEFGTRYQIKPVE